MKEKGYLDTNGGIGFLGVLQVVFIVLKLTNNIDWSWWWVFSPIWGPILLAVVIWFVIAILAVSEFRSW